MCKGRNKEVNNRMKLRREERRVKKRKALKEKRKETRRGKKSRGEDGSFKEAQMPFYRKKSSKNFNSYAPVAQAKMTQWSTAPFASLLFQLPVGEIFCPLFPVFL